MSESIATRARYITVAVGFDRHSVPLTRYAAHLCQKLGKELCLLHVVEPWLDKPHSVPQGENDPLWNVTQAVETNASELAARRLDELATEVWPGIQITKRVAKGKSVPTLCQEAMNLGSMLLLVGADIENLRFLPKGLSTALSLMVSSPVPVLVVDTRIFKDKSPSTHRIMVADDLSQESEAALEFAFDLASSGGKTALHHVHVNGLTFEALQSGLVTAAATSHSPLDKQTTADLVFQSLVSGLEGALNKRCQSQREYLEAGGGSYEASVLTGSVAKQIADHIGQIKPDILIFGRHHAYHRRPFFIGRVPYRTMLSSHIPIVVVPEQG
jgi:nucleotide-binding universal stress UspA family protein